MLIFIALPRCPRCGCHRVLPVADAVTRDITYRPCGEVIMHPSGTRFMMANFIEYGPVARTLRLPLYRPSQHRPDLPTSGMLMLANILAAQTFAMIASMCAVGWAVETVSRGFPLVFLFAGFLAIRFIIFAYHAGVKFRHEMNAILQWYYECQMEDLVNARRQARFYNREAWYCPSCEGVYLRGRHEVLPPNRLAELLDRP